MRTKKSMKTTTEKATRRPRGASGATGGGKCAGTGEETIVARPAGVFGGAGVPDYFLPVWPSAAELERARRAEVPELLVQGQRVAKESAAFLICCELAERIRRRLDGGTVAGWLYVDLDDEEDDVAGWLEVLKDSLPGAEPREVVRGLRDVWMASFEEGADKSELLRKVAVWQRAAVAGLVRWRNMVGIIYGILVAKGWAVKRDEVERMLREAVESIKNGKKKLGGRRYERYKESAKEKWVKRMETAKWGERAEITDSIMDEFKIPRDDSGKAREDFIRSCEIYRRNLKKRKP